MAEKADAAASANLDEMRRILSVMPGPDLEAGTSATLRERQLTKPAGALGRLEELAEWLAVWQGRHPATVDHPRTAVFAGNHGVSGPRRIGLSVRRHRPDGAEFRRWRGGCEPALRHRG